MTHFSTGKWVQATSLGWLAGIALIILLAAVFESVGMGEMQFFMGVGIGAGTALMQWRLLRKVSAIDKSWIWRTIAGTGVPFLAFDIIRLVTHISSGPFFILYGVAVSGILTGLRQAPLLKKYGATAAMWTLASFAGWMGACLAFFCINYTKVISNNNWVLFGLNLALMLSGGVILGAVTGIYIKRLSFGNTVSR